MLTSPGAGHIFESFRCGVQKQTVKNRINKITTALNDGWVEQHVYLPSVREWLDTNNIPNDILVMRPKGCREADWVVKYDLFKEYVEPHYSVLGIFDDRQQVVDMWRKMGLTCFQVAEGDF